MTPKGTTYTYNEGTYVYSYSYTFWYKNTYNLAAWTWTSRTGTTSSSKCKTVPGQKVKFTTDADAKVKKYTTVISNASNAGFCKGGTLSYYGPAYEYKKKGADDDNTFTMTDTIKSNKNKYELIVGYDINVT
ncbi:MAG TPA: hypothetical protein VHX61_05190 [Rhizomicrobium sp.]|nr:hypothetical protein [Rhizomicrobium sp.]